MINDDQIAAFDEENIVQRRRRLAIIKLMSEFKKDGRIANRFTLQGPLKEAGHDVSTGTIYRDLTVINRDNTWVKDLVESNYSAMQEHIANMLDFIEKEALENYRKKWTYDKVVKRNGTTTKGDFESYEEVITQEMAAPKVQFLEILGKVQQLRMKHTHGDNINISAALLSTELQNAKDELQKSIKENKTPIVTVLDLSKKVTLDGHNQQ